MSKTINVSKGSVLRFQINNRDYTETIRESCHDPMLPGDSIVCIVDAPEGVKVGDMVLMPDIEPIRNFGVIKQWMLDKGGISISVPQSAVDLDSIGH
jgi:hypothetical protein